ncbi:MAG: hypothetical protein AB7K04_14865 [Pseudorhodoplanes sp.]
MTSISDGNETRNYIGRVGGTTRVLRPAIAVQDTPDYFGGRTLEKVAQIFRR